jgi:glycosyltransferase involved in cell wall biosynthesis
MRSSSVLRIVLVVDQPVPVAKYGGTERMVVWMAQLLLRLGHQLILVAPSSSALPGVTHWPANTQAQARQILLQHQGQYDLVHLHGWYGAGEGLPAVATLHGNMQLNESFPLPNWVCISADHARRHGRHTFVHNGLPVDEYPFNAIAQRQALFFSKVKRKSKGIARTLKMARQSGWQLDVAGGRRLDLIKAGGLLDSLSPKIHFHGEVGGVRKLALLQQAAFMVFPIEWDEPFGLAVVESMLCGTPVLASPRGSMPELIVNGVSGQLCQSDADFAQAAENVPHLDRVRCRQFAADTFPIERCVARYLELYHRVLQGEVLS